MEVQSLVTAEVAGGAGAAVSTASGLDRNRQVCSKLPLFARLITIKLFQHVTKILSVLFNFPQSVPNTWFMSILLTAE